MTDKLVKKLDINEQDIDMMLCSNRVNTFQNWPFSEEDKCTPERMAAAGFYGCGGSKEPDLARCFVCRKEMDGWEPSDDPWEEHKRSARGRCGYVNLNKKPEDISIQDFIKLINEKHEHLQRKIMESRDEQLQAKSGVMEAALLKLCK